MHCGASLSELHGALVFHRKCLGKRLGHQMYMVVFVEECSMGIFSSWVHCHCVGVSNRWSGIDPYVHFQSSCSHKNTVTQYCRSCTWYFLHKQGLTLHIFAVIKLGVLAGHYACADEASRRDMWYAIE